MGKTSVDCLAYHVILNGTVWSREYGASGGGGGQGLLGSSGRE